jgi:tripartite-type tricarboxylate transporter receptor subunit TctC
MRRTFVFGLVCTSLAAAGPALAQEVLAPTAGGFPSDGIVLMVIDEPGSADSVYANQLVEAAQPFSPVPIRIEHREDFSNFGTWEAIRWMIDQGPEANDGSVVFVYTVPGSVIDLLVIDMETELGVGLDDLNVVVSTEQLPYFIHQRADAPWGDTMQDFIDHATANPGTIRYISGGPGGAQDAAFQWYLRQFDITVNEIIGGGGGARALTVAAGDGDVTLSPPDLILPHFEGGKVDVLMMTGDGVSPAPWEAVPNSASFGITGDPWKQTRGIGVPPGVPEENRAWLEQLFTTAATQSAYQANRLQVPGLQTTILDAAGTIALAQTAYDESLPMMQEMGVYWGDQ